MRKAKWVLPSTYTVFMLWEWRWCYGRISIVCNNIFIVICIGNCNSYSICLNHNNSYNFEQIKKAPH